MKKYDSRQAKARVVPKTHPGGMRVRIVTLVLCTCVLLGLPIKVGSAQSPDAASDPLGRSVESDAAAPPDQSAATTYPDPATTGLPPQDAVTTKPPAAKGKYLKSVTVSSTMGPGVRIDTAAVETVAH